jgi:hypothetical protein
MRLRCELGAFTVVVVDCHFLTVSIPCESLLFFFCLPPPPKHEFLNLHFGWSIS